MLIFYIIYISRYINGEKTLHGSNKSIIVFIRRVYKEIVEQ